MKTCFVCVFKPLSYFEVLPWIPVMIVIILSIMHSSISAHLVAGSTYCIALMYTNICICSLVIARKVARPLGPYCSPNIKVPRDLTKSRGPFSASADHQKLIRNQVSQRNFDGNMFYFVANTVFGDSMLGQLQSEFWPSIYCRVNWP